MYLFQFSFMHNIHYGKDTIINIETQAQWGIRFALMESTVFCKADTISQWDIYCFRGDTGAIKKITG